MKPLTKAMQAMHTTVPSDWADIPKTINGKTLQALKRRGLVQTRWHEKAKRNVVAQWRKDHQK